MKARLVWFFAALSVTMIGFGQPAAQASCEGWGPSNGTVNISPGVPPATSDPNAIAETAEFILNLNRANVAFTRSKRRLIVVCARDLLDFVPTAYKVYQDAILWKLLRNLCTHLIDTMTVDGVTVRVYTPQPSTHMATDYDTGIAT